MDVRLLMAAGFAFSLAGSASAQRSEPMDTVPAYRARLLGVYDELSGAALQGVTVSDALTGASSLTSATGTVSLIFLPNGGSIVRLQKIGYETQTLRIAISVRDTFPVTMTMRRITQLPTVVTTDSAPHYLSPGLRGFVERSRRESGRFIGETELRKNDGRELANLLRSKAPGVKIVEGRGHTMYLMQSTRCVAGGPPQVYVDGVPAAADAPASPSPATRPPAGGGAPRIQRDSPTVPPFNLSNYQVGDLAGVEWYPDGDSAPIEFAHTSQRCGALLLWTRER